MNLRIRCPSVPGLVAACTVLMLGPVNSAQAAAVVGPDATVRFDDLTLSDPGDAERLLSRIRDAAAGVCAPLDHGDITSRRHRDRCQGELVNVAVNKVNHPQLYAVYSRHARATARIAEARRSDAGRQSR